MAACVCSAKGRLENAPPPPPRKTEPPDGIADRPDGRRQTELAHHLGGQLGGLGEVVGGARRALAEHDELARPAAEADRQHVVEVVLAVEVALDEGELLGDAERLSGRQDRHLGDRVRLVRVRGDEGVAGLVHGDGVLLVGKQHVRALAPTEDDAVTGFVEVRGA